MRPRTISDPILSTVDKLIFDLTTKVLPIEQRQQDPGARYATNAVGKRAPRRTVQTCTRAPPQRRVCGPGSCVGVVRLSRGAGWCPLPPRGKRRGEISCWDRMCGGGARVRVIS